MKKLQDNLNSQYISAANRLKPNQARRRVVAYVESYDDVSFWRGVLQEFESPRLCFEVMLPSRTNLGKGKKSVLMNRLGSRLGECMIACVDADYDFLMQGLTAASREVLDNPYVFHTYVYAIENYQCYAPGLHEACVTATMNDRRVVDFEAFLAEYSAIIWPLFVWNVWGYRYDRYHDFSLLDFCGVVALREVSPHHPEKALEHVRRQVNRQVAVMQRRHPEAKKTYRLLRDELLSLGLTPETTYLYMQGHSLFEGVVMPLLTPLCTLLRKEREAEIRHLAVHEQQRQNELASYQRSQSPVELMLRKGSGFRRSRPYGWLLADLREFVDNLSHHP